MACMLYSTTLMAAKHAFGLKITIADVKVTKQPVSGLIVIWHRLTSFYKAEQIVNLLCRATTCNTCCATPAIGAMKLGISG